MSRSEYFGVGKAVSVQNCESALLGSRGEAENSLKELTSQQLLVICSVLSEAIISYTADEHAYDNHEDDVAVEIALTALNYFELYNKLDDIGCRLLLSKTKLSKSLGFSSKQVFSHISLLGEDEVDHQLVDNVLLGHLQAFGLDHVAIKEDGNCFFLSSFFLLVDNDIFVDISVRNVAASRQIRYHK